MKRLASEQALRRHRPQGERWASALERGDPLADAVADRIAADPTAMGALHRALSGTPAGRSGGSLPPELDAIFTSVAKLPLGVDLDAIARGGRLFFRTGAAGGLALGAGCWTTSRGASLRQRASCLRSTARAASCPAARAGGSRCTCA